MSIVRGVDKDVEIYIYIHFHIFMWRQRMGWSDSITDSMAMSLSKPGRQWRTDEPGVLQSLGFPRVGHNSVTKQQSITELVSHTNKDV